VRNQPIAEASEPDSYRHRLPLGLWMLSRKWITSHQLAQALKMQAEQREGRIGEWLIKIGAVTEEMVATGVAGQWGIAVIPAQDPTQEAKRTVPALLCDTFGCLPIRVAADRLLYLAVEQQVDHGLNRAIEHMSGLEVVPVVMAARGWHSARFSEFGGPHSRANGDGSSAARGRFFRSTSKDVAEAWVLSLLDEQPTRNVLVDSVGRFLWLRMERGRPQASPAAAAHGIAGSGPHDGSATWIEDCLLDRLGFRDASGPENR